MTKPSKNFESVDAQSINTNQIYDTAGRYLGTLTGTNDAQVLIDAIADRTSNAGLIFPDPGFDLDWEQQVDLPTDEVGFSIQTLGTPRIVPDYSGGLAFRIPPSSSGGHSWSLFDNGLIVDDFATANDLDAVLRVQDVSGSSHVGPIRTDGVPAVQIRGGNSGLADWWFYQPHTYKAGPVVDITPQANYCNDIRLIGPFFGSQNSNTIGIQADGSQTTGAVDNLQIFWPRTEFCTIPIDLTDVQSYTIWEGEFDRSQDYEYSIRENDANCSGKIFTRNSKDVYRRALICSPNTEIIGLTQIEDATRVEDFFEDLRTKTPAQSFNTIGLRDNSSGGVVDIQNFGQSGFFRVRTTGATAGDYGEVDQGGFFQLHVRTPKYMGSIRAASSSDTSAVTVRTGFVKDAANRVELVYDTSGTVTTLSSTNWVFQVEEGGTITNEIDMGVAPSTGFQNVAVGRIRRDGGDAADTQEYYATAGTGQNVQTIQPSGSFSALQWRTRVRTREAADKAWQFPQANPRLWAL